nr:MAG TPA: hypothetical protein [Caudoviricetes sp.]
MSYLKDVKDSLNSIDELCRNALREDDDYRYYINEIRDMAYAAISDFESLIYELKVGKEKLIEAKSIIEEYIDGKD